MRQEVMRTLVVVLVGVWVAGVRGIEHNLPEGVELVDPKDLGLDSQIDLDKLLGNVKALPIDGNALSSALGKPGLKTQVLTVGFDGSEGINLDDFELPQLKNDEHGPLAQAAFSSFKDFLIKNSTSATPVEEEQPQQKVTTHRPGGKRRVGKRRKVVKTNGTSTTSTTSTPAPEVEVPHEPEQSAPQPVLGPAGPKVIELDSSQIEKLIASGKIGPPKTFGAGGPQIIELGQKDLDALLSSANGDELKQILEGGEPVKDFDLSQITGAPYVPPPTTAEIPPRVTESYPRVNIATAAQTSRPEVEEPPVLEVASTQPPPTTRVVQQYISEQYITPSAPSTTPPPPPPPVFQQQPQQPQQDNNAGLPIIYQYNSAQDQQHQQQQQFQQQQQQIQSQVPLQLYSGSVNGEQQAKFVKHPTFEFISAPPVSFSSSVLPSNEGNNNNNQVAPQPPLPPQIPQVLLQPQQHQQFRNTFISPTSSQFIPAGAPPSSPSHNEVPISSPHKPSDQSLNKIVPAKQQSAHTEQFKPSSISHSSSPNFIQNVHKVNLPVNSIKLVTPSPHSVQSLLSQVPASFSPALAPSHIVNSPVVNPLQLSAGSQQFIPNEPFRNTQLFTTPKRPPPPPPPPQGRNPIASTSHFRFPGASATTSFGGSANRFRTAESSNPFFNYAAVGQNQYPNLILNSFIAGDGLNYRPISNQAFQRPGI